MATEPPEHTITRVQVDGEGLEGWLWLAKGEAQVMFGEHGRAVDRRVISDVCWCAGSIWGPGLTISKDWARVSLSRAQDRLLDRLACTLWEAAIEQFKRQSDREAPKDRKQRRAFVELRDALHGLFMRLHGRFGEHMSKRNRKRARKKHKKPRDRHAQLYARVSDIPVLELSTGRWISAEVAERERPIELASMNLWSGPSAQELAHQRTVERREAERAREQAREQERDRERARRHAEAAARSREADRRREAEREAKRIARREAEREQKERREANKSRQASKSSKKSDKKSSKRAKPKAPKPEALLLEAIRQELRLVRANNAGLVSNRHLESLVLGEPHPRGPLLRHVDNRTEIDVGHSLFQAALDGYLGDQGLLTLLASSAYTYLNIIHVEIEDVHEDEFLRLHAAHAATGVSADDD